MVNTEKIDYLITEQIRKVLTSFDLRVNSDIRNNIFVPNMQDTTEVILTDSVDKLTTITPEQF